MDGKGRWRDYHFEERVWKLFNFEEVYLHACESVNEARTSIGNYLEFYNSIRRIPAWIGSRPIRSTSTACWNLSRLNQEQELPLKNQRKLSEQPGTDQG